MSTRWTIALSSAARSSARVRDGLIESYRDYVNPLPLLGLLQ